MIITDESKLRLISSKADLSKVELIRLTLIRLEMELLTSKIKGYGLSAIQISEPVRLSVIRMPKLKLDLINPIILEKEDPFVFKGEGCLSFPNIYHDTNRFKQITVENQAVEGNVEKLVFVDLEAVVIQHEIDHLDGILFMDHKLKPIIVSSKIGRNDLCSCGSGKKYKKCCGR